MNFNNEETKSLPIIDGTNQISIEFKNDTSSILSNYSITLQNNVSSFICNAYRGHIDAKCISAMIGSNVTNLPYQAFRNALLSSIYIPRTV